MPSFKNMMIVVSAVLTLAGGVKVYHLAVNYFETSAHASVKYETIEGDVAMLGKAFQGYAMRQELRDYKDERYELSDRYDTTNPMLIEDQEDRDRYRYLIEQIEILEDELKRLEER